MFPQLVAGPIVRATDLLPQLATPGNFNVHNRMAGLRQAVWGYVKKTVIADNIAPVVNDIFGQVEVVPNAPLWWAGAGLFAIQIFADFSGYSDIACGIARWMGYRYPENFKQPYAAIGFRDFWCRWHISLSTWFRDYVYIPLGGSYAGSVRSLWNLVLTMLISGLWHGANWTFVVWGGLHGGFLIGERVFGKLTPIKTRMRFRYIGWLITMMGVLVGWVVFRATSLQQAVKIVQTMFVGAWDVGSMAPVLTANAAVALSVCLIATVWWMMTHREILRPITAMPYRVQSALIVLGIVISVFLRGPGDDFIYFQF